ncbi:MAG: alanine racemase [Solobacterium sp.]|nr:alanine racemase [Solobacterium sp.]
MYRNTWMEVNLDAIKDNVIRSKEICRKRIIAVLKADAYGCGDSHVARAVLSAGAEMLAVSSMDEALMLRNEGYEGKILILGATEKEDVELLIKEKISVAAYSAAWVDSITKQNCVGLQFHLKIDTGMNRIGFKTIEEAKWALESLLNAGCIAEGIFTHFACADQKDQVETNKQFTRFKEVYEALNYNFPWIHTDNSDATLSFKDELTNACRIGISMYGVNNYDISLRYPISLHTKVIMVKEVDEGERIGYGLTYQAKKKEYIATLPIGYADGFVRKNQGRCVYIDGQYCEVVGRVCMDQVMVRLEKEVPIGTDVEIFGPHIHLEKMAEELDTIPYEVICLISGRVTRTYIWEGENLEENARILKSEIAEVHQS